VLRVLKPAVILLMTDNHRRWMISTEKAFILTVHRACLRKKTGPTFLYAGRRGSTSTDAGLRWFACVPLVARICAWFCVCTALLPCVPVCTRTTIIPPTKDEAHTSFEETKPFVDNKGAIKSRIRLKCLCVSAAGVACEWSAVYRNLDQVLVGRLGVRWSR
jgi:hypothetical protein